MCSPISTRLRLLTLVIVLTALVSTAGSTGTLEAAQANTERPGPADIARALDIVKADPNLATERTIKMLRWKDATEQASRGSWPWLAWIMGLFRWLEQSARMFIWGAAVVLAALLAVYIVRLLRAGTSPSREPSFAAPTHVQDLDIRPESLPEDVGMAARALWDRGEHRASLALLYRGMLSRLAHVHGVPIRDSSTEGDCLSLAANHLSQRPCEYASRLIGVWQEFVYGGEHTEPSTVYVLCDRFAVTLDASTPVDLFRQSTTA
jgi:hypothetical protein